MPYAARTFLSSFYGPVVSYVADNTIIAYFVLLGRLGLCLLRRRLGDLVHAAREQKLLV